MKKTLLWLSLVLLSVTGNSQDYKTTNTIQEQLEDFRILKTTILESHAGAYTYNDSASLAFNFDKLEKELARASLTKVEQLALYSKFIQTLQCIHTSVYHEKLLLRNLKVKFKLPFEVYFVNNELISKLDYKQEEIRVHKYDRILAINNELISEIRDSLYQFISSDGNNISFKNQKLKHEFLYYYFLYKQQEADCELTYLHNGDTLTRVFPFVFPKKHKKIKQEDTITFEVNQSSGYAKLNLPIPLKNSKKYKKSIDKFMDEVFQDSIDHLIIDLRGLPGGRSQEYMLGYFINDSILMNTESFSGIHHSTYRKQFKNRLNGQYMISNLVPRIFELYGEVIENKSFVISQNQIYNGQVYVLINGGTASAASNLASFFKEWTDAIVVGEESGGGYRYYTTAGAVLQLPNSKIKVDIRSMKGTNNVKNTYENDGVTPHYPIQESSFFDSDEDPPLDFILNELIKKNNR